MEVLSTEMPVLFFLFVLLRVFMWRVMRQGGGTGKWTQPILVFDCLIDIFTTAHTLRNLNTFRGSEQTFVPFSFFFFPHV